MKRETKSIHPQDKDFLDNRCAVATTLAFIATIAGMMAAALIT